VTGGIEVGGKAVQEAKLEVGCEEAEEEADAFVYTET